MDIIDVINEPWQGHTKGEVETALKGKLREIGNTDTFNVRLNVIAPPALSKDNNVAIDVIGISTVTHPGNVTEDVAEVLIIEIQTRTSTNDPWTARANDNVTSNQPSYKSIDISKYLSVGDNFVRIRAVGDNASSMWYSYQIRVVNLQLYNNNTFEVPIDSTDEFSLRYLIGGAVQKTLYVQIGRGKGSQFVMDYTANNGRGISVGERVNLTTGELFTFEDLPAIVMQQGVHTVKAYLLADEDATVKTDVVETQYMVIDQQAASQNMVILNNVNENIDNYTDVTFFNYAVHTDEEQLGVVFKLKHGTSDELLSSWEVIARNGINYTLSTDLSLETTEDVIYAYMYAEDLEGNQLSDRAFFTINNESKYSPVTGADFILSPANRSNDEQNPKTIINAANGEIVESTWENFDMQSDGYMSVNKDVESISENAEKIRALHIPANRKLTIAYNPLKEFINSEASQTGLVGKNMTLEIDFRTYNILDEDESVIKLGTTSSIDGDIYGFEVKPLEACVLTKNSRVRDDQNVSWAEGERTRLTLNILYGLNPNNDPSRTVNYNFVRMFINDKIEREFFYKANDSFLAGNANLVIGATGSDVDIFSIRCYQKALSTTQVMQDYVSGLSTSTEKVQWQAKNNILGDNDAISFSEARKAGYNVIGHTGHLPKYGDEDKGKTKNVSIYIGISGDPQRSGTLTGLDGLGQGTTAMTYYDWNQQYKVTDNTTWIPDEEGLDFGAKGYAIADGEALAKKLVGKINFASSQQGHKLGLTWAYTDLFKELVRRNNITNPGQMELLSNARISVFEKPFLFFHRETENDPWVFKYLMTFGAGKGDKPTFGFNKNTTRNMMMVEGADNDVPMALFAIPWDDKVTYDADAEAWMYNNRKNINFGFGRVTEIGNKEYPEENEGFAAIKSFFNFVYNHNVSVIRYYDGSLDQLRTNTPRPQQGISGTAEPSKGLVYWLTNADNRYELYRYDNDEGWINAGYNEASINIRTVYENYCSEIDQSPAEWVVGQWNDIASSFKAVVTEHFKKYAPDYIHVDDALYHSCFIKFFAGTDNRAKNTYYYTDPSDCKIRFEQDDLDTTIKTNNVGQNRKPYYVEEHDKNSAGAYYWQGENNGFYNLLEDAFSADMTAMMKNLLTAMASISGSAMQFMVDYVLFAQDYFPATAFNEMTRTVYEVAAVAQQDGIYVNNNASAITQANGSQRWSEYQWLKDRIMYISSWCEYGEFAGSSDASGALGFRGAGTSGGRQNVYNFTLTPAKWLYPRISQGESNLDASVSARRVRVPAGQAIDYKSFSLDSDSAVAIKGINYYLAIGDMNVPLSIDQTKFAFNGKRLQEITINPDGDDDNLFITQTIEIGNATNIKEFVARNVTTIRNTTDLSKCVRLETIDVRDSSVPSITLPNSMTLEEVNYSAQTLSIDIIDKPNLTTVTIQGVNNLENVVCRRTSDTVAKTVIGILNREGLTNLQRFVWEQGTNTHAVSLTNDEMVGIINLALNENVSSSISGYVHPIATITTYQEWVLNTKYPNLVLVDATVTEAAYDVVFENGLSTANVNEGSNIRFISLNVGLESLKFRIHGHTITKDDLITDEVIQGRINIVGDRVVVGAAQENSSWSDTVIIQALPVYQEWDDGVHTPKELTLQVQAVKVTGATINVPTLVKPANATSGNILLSTGHTKPVVTSAVNDGTGIFVVPKLGDTLLGKGSDGLSFSFMSPSQEGTYNVTCDVYAFSTVSPSYVLTPVSIQVLNPYIQFTVTTDGTFSDISSANPKITLQKVDSEDEPIGQPIVLTGTVSGSSLVYTYGNGNIAGDGSETYKVTFDEAPELYRNIQQMTITPNQVITEIAVQYVVKRPDLYFVYGDGDYEPLSTIEDRGSFKSGKTRIGIAVVSDNVSFMFSYNYTLRTRPVDPGKEISLSTYQGAIPNNPLDAADDFNGILNSSENYRLLKDLDDSDDSFAWTVNNNEFYKAHESQLVVNGVTLQGYIASLGEIMILATNRNYLNTFFERFFSMNWTGIDFFCSSTRRDGRTFWGFRTSTKEISWTDTGNPSYGNAMMVIYPFNM